jgi:hypothetical protein
VGDDVNVSSAQRLQHRDDILRRDLADLVVRPGTTRRAASCTTVHRRVRRVRPRPARRTVQIDHLVSLSDAWYKGAREWDHRADVTANVAQPARRQRQAQLRQGISRCPRLPPNRASLRFVARQIDVKAAYGLWLSKNEKRAMEDVLARC